MDNPEEDSKSRGGLSLPSTGDYEEYEENKVHESLSEVFESPQVKFEPQQIDKLIDTFDNSDQRDHTRQMTMLLSTRILVVASLAFVIGLCWLFLAYGAQEFISEIISALVGLVGGLLGGYGIGRKFSD